MKKLISLILAVLLLTGCSTGISQEEYDKVVAERDAAIAERDKAADAKASAESERDTARTELETVQEEVAALQSSNEELKAQNLELVNSAADNISKEIGENAITIVYESVAKSISENAVTSLLWADVVQITIPMGMESAETIQQQVIDYTWAITSALDSGNVQTCIIMAVDTNGRCVFGYSFHSSGAVEPFLSNLYAP